MNVPEFDGIAREAFAPAYIAIAEQIKEKTGITEGFCLDVGAGGGYLGIALARITELDVFLLDNSRDMLDIALRNIIADSLETRVRILFGDAHEIPVNDGSIDLVISRGSVFFWKDKTRAFNEIHRIIAPGGRAYIGGGLGTSEIEKQVMAKMKKIGKSRPCRQDDKTGNQEACRQALERACIENCIMTSSDAGLWIEIWK
jgi:ubiquinone/menaquinone biosynthesis C-methylase UbiE